MRRFRPVPGWNSPQKNFLKEPKDGILATPPKVSKPSVQNDCWGQLSSLMERGEFLARTMDEPLHKQTDNECQTPRKGRDRDIWHLALYFHLIWGSIWFYLFLFQQSGGTPKNGKDKQPDQELHDVPGLVSISASLPVFHVYEMPFVRI